MSTTNFLSICQLRWNWNVIGFEIGEDQLFLKMIRPRDRRLVDIDDDWEGGLVETMNRMIRGEKKVQREE